MDKKLIDLVSKIFRGFGKGLSFISALVAMSLFIFLIYLFNGKN